MKCRCSNCGWLEVNPSGAMFCGYFDVRTWENESCLAWKDKDEPQSNADRIRAMSDEELAEFLYNVWKEQDTFSKEVCEKCGDTDIGCQPNCWLNWLRKEADE